MDQELIELVEQAKVGKKWAFGKLYGLFYQRIYRFIYYLTYDKQLSEDLTQNTFLKAWRALPNFSTAKGTFQSFLFTIARNLVIDVKRKNKEFYLDENIDISSKEDLEDEYQRQESKQVIAKALEGLEPEEKQIVILRYFEELSFAEIARVINKKEGALRVRIHRILIKLKEQLEKNGS